MLNVWFNRISPTSRSKAVVMARPVPVMVTGRAAGPLPGSKSHHFGQPYQRYENESQFKYLFFLHDCLLIFNWRLMICL
jgi:hypothetical protein